MKMMKIVLCFTFCLMMSSCSDFLTNSEIITTETENQQKITRTYADKIMVYLPTVSGDCIVQTGDDDSIHVSVQHTYDENVFMAEFSVLATVLYLEEKFPPDTNAEGSSTWILTIPSETHIQFVSTSGNLEASDKTGSVIAETASGNINVANMENCMMLISASGDINTNNTKGTSYFQTASGNISVEDFTADSTSSFTSDSGDVYVKLAESADQDLILSSTSGEAILDYNGNTVNGTFTFVAKQNSGHISCPFAFDTETTFWDGYNWYMKKTVVRNTPEPNINISTASGTARLIL